VPERPSLTTGIRALHRSVAGRSGSSASPHALHAFAESLSQLETDYRRVGQEVIASTALRPVRAAKARTSSVRASPSAPSRPVLRALIELAKLVSSDVVYVAGCGDGRVALAAAKRPRVEVVGIDPDAGAIEAARRHARRARVGKRVRFMNASLFEVDLRHATVVILERVPLDDAALSRQLLDRLRPGTRIVSHTADLGHWVTVESRPIEGRPVRCWVVPARGGASKRLRRE
jgi:SAM-dependent methyltransferase